MEREEGRRCKIVARSRSITFVCGSTRVHTRSIRAGSIDRSIDRRIIEPTVPCNIVSGGSERETKEEKAEGERGAFRFQAYFITKPQFQPGFAVVSRRRERERRDETKGRKKEKKSGEGEGGGGSFRAHEVTCALSSRPRASCRVFNAGYRRYVRIFCLLRFTSPFTSAPGSSWRGFYGRTNVERDKFIAEYARGSSAIRRFGKLLAQRKRSRSFSFFPRFHPLCEKRRERERERERNEMARTKKTKLWSSKVKTNCGKKKGVESNTGDTIYLFDIKID